MRRESPEDHGTLIMPSQERQQAYAAPTHCFADGRYQVLRPLGEGGQKQVYLATDTRLGREVVISLLRTQQLDQGSKIRLWREAQSMAQLGDHPYIVTIYDIGEESGRPFIISQFIDGGSVADLLMGADKHRLPMGQALNIASQICHALAHTHGRGIVHRDLKPQNVWLTKDGTAKLGDFGLALGMDFSRVTMEGTVIGTVAYLAPEVALGREAGPRSDLYSLGVMMYEMVAGQRPFQGGDAIAIISQHINTPPVAPSWHSPDIPQALEGLILRMLAKSPEERPDSALEVLRELEAIASFGPAAKRPLARQHEKSLARLAAGVFVGREQEMAQLRAGLEDAISGRGRLLMLVGEPGSGKTRATEQLATYARLRDAQVLVGRCYEGEGAPAFWPWVQITRSYTAERDAAELMSAMGPGAVDIAQLVSEVRERLPDLPRQPALEPAQARFRLFDSITTFLKTAAAAQPLALILDDLHWADKSSLLLLQFLAGELRDARILVIGTYRDMEVGRHHPLAQTLAELARHSLGERIPLRGLAEHEVSRFIEMTAGIDPPDQLVAAVYKDTEGNPFFVSELVRLLVSEDRLREIDFTAGLELRIPEGVREVIGRRLDHLSEPCNRVLTIASVIGREFSLNILRPLGGMPEEQLLNALEEAVASRIITELPKVIGRYSFSHALIRETLYDEVSANRRVRLHLRVAEELERAYGAEIYSHLAELAYHSLHAAPAGYIDKAIGYAVKAAERAAALFAYEESVIHYQQALEALELKPGIDEARRCELLLALADAQRKAGIPKARETFLQVTNIGKRIGAPELVALGALGIGAGVSGGTVGSTDESQVTILREALEALGENDSSLRAKLLASLSIALYYSPPELRLSISQQAVDMARRISEPTALVAALYSRHAALTGSVRPVQERFAVATEILQIAQMAGNKEMELRAHYRRIIDLTEMGDVDSVDREIEAYSRLAEELRQPIYMWYTPFLKAARVLMQGEFEVSERLAYEAMAIGKRAHDPTAFLFFGVIMNLLRVTQGRADEQVSAVIADLERYPMITGNRATLAYVHANANNELDARREFDLAAANDFDDLPRDGSWIVVLSMLSYACYWLGDARRAQKLYALLAPYADRNIVTGSAAVGCGSVSRALALLAVTMSRWHEAARHFEDAIEMNARMGAKPFIAGAQYEYARMLLMLDAPGHRDKAMDLLAQAHATATSIENAKLTKKVEELMAAPETSDK